MMVSTAEVSKSDKALEGVENAQGNETAETSQSDLKKRRVKLGIYGVVNYALLFLFAGVTAALSFHGLVGYGRTNLALSGGWEYLVPISLDGAAMFSAVMAIRQATDGESAVGARMYVWTFAGASAAFNWIQAPSGENHTGAQPYFAGMSIAAALLFDRALKMTQRDSLKAQGLISKPLPRIHLQRWLFSPISSTKAKFELVKRIRPDMNDELREVLEEQQARKEERAQQRQAKNDQREMAKLVRMEEGPSPKRIGRGRKIPELTAAPPTNVANVASTSKKREELALSHHHRPNPAEALKAKLDASTEKVVRQPDGSEESNTLPSEEKIATEDEVFAEFTFPDNISYDNLDESLKELTSGRI